MAPRFSLIERISSRQDMLRALAILAAVLVAMAVLTVALGVTNSGPSYDLIADPGPGLPF